MAPPEPTGARPPAKRSRALAALAVVLVSGGVYLNSLGNDLVWDDVAVIGQNRLIRDVGNLPRVFATHYWDLGKPGERVTGNYRPVTIASYLLNYQVAGPSPLAFRVVNVLLHALAALLVLELGLALGLSLRAALAAGLVFGVHPVHVEAVVWITGRAELLATLGVLGALLAHLRWRRDGSRAWMGAALASLSLGLFAKESAFAFVPLVVVVELALSAAEGASGPALRARLLRCTPYLGAALAYFGARYAAIGGVADRGGSDPGFFFVGATAREIFLTMVQVFAAYWRLLVFPLELSASYDQSQFPVPASVLEPQLVAAIAVHVMALAAVAILWRSRRHLAALSAAWVYVALLPYSHLIHFEWLMAERFLYLPSVGIALGAGLALHALASRQRAPAPAAAVLAGTLVVIGLLSSRTIVRNRDWSDELRFFGILAREKPDLVGARYSCGAALLRAGRFEEATVEYEATVRLRPDLVDAQRTLELLHSRRRALGPGAGGAPAGRTGARP